MTTKILHISDTHLGYRQYQSDIRREDFARAFDAAVEIAIDEDVDATIHGGDLFDHPTPNVPTVNRSIDIISKLSDEDIPFYGIVGNHERKLDEQWMDLIKRLSNAERLTTSPTTVTDEDGENPVALYGIDSVRSPEWDTFDFTLTRPSDDSAVTVLCMHELFKPFVPEHRGNPYELSEVINRLNFKPDAIALGDFHRKCQNHIDDVLAFYPGSTERCKVTETRNRGVWVIEVDEGEIGLRFRTINSAGTGAPRDFVVVKVELTEDDGIDRVEQRVNEELAGDDISEKCVDVTLLGKEAPVTSRDVYAYLNRRGVAVSHVTDKRDYGIDLDIEFEQRETADLDTMLDDAVNELDIDAAVSEAENLVRNRDVATSNIRDHVNEVIRSAQEAEFGESTIGSR
ncbi:metallophosphoesterase family protein [Natrialbaceae archaeon A-CW3]